MKCPIFWSKGTWSPVNPVKAKCSRYAFKSNQENSPNNLLNKHIQYTGWEFCDNAKWLNARFANICIGEDETAWWTDGRDLAWDTVSAIFWLKTLGDVQGCRQRSWPILTTEIHSPSRKYIAKQIISQTNVLQSKSEISFSPIWIKHMRGPDAKF